MQEFWEKKLTKTGIFTHFSHGFPIQKEAPSRGRFQKFTILLLLNFINRKVRSENAIK